MKTCKTDPFPLGTVLKDELAEIEAARKARFGQEKDYWKEKDARAPSSQNLAKPEWQIRDIDWTTTIQKAHDAHLVGLAFSGGGIRSAAFNLGLLGGLADRGLLRRMDYLSTVSGGGYIGGWLATWAKRRKSIRTVQDCLRKEREKQDEDNEPTPIRFLRIFSNYLTPRIGLFSADTWTMVATYLRNLLLNLAIVFSFLVVGMLLPRLCLSFVSNSELRVVTAWAGAVLEGVLLVIAGLMITANMASLDAGRPHAKRHWTKEGRVFALVGIPLFGLALIGALWPVWWLPCLPVCQISYSTTALLGAGMYSSIAILACAFEETFAAGLRTYAQRQTESPHGTPSSATSAIKSASSKHGNRSDRGSENAQSGMWWKRWKKPGKLSQHIAVKLEYPDTKEDECFDTSPGTHDVQFTVRTKPVEKRTELKIDASIDCVERWAHQQIMLYPPVTIDMFQPDTSSIVSGHAQVFTVAIGRRDCSRGVTIEVKSSNEDILPGRSFSIPPGEFERKITLNAGQVSKDEMVLSITHNSELTLRR